MNENENVYTGIKCKLDYWIIVKQCKDTYLKIWSGGDLGPLLGVVSHREVIANQMSEREIFFFHVN